MWTTEKTVSKGDYVYAVVHEHPYATKNGYVLLHRIVMENHLERLLDPKELVHHMDENKKNNDILNLEIMTSSEHAKHHAHPPEYLYLICTHCKVEFERRLNQRASVKGYKNAFCSRSCNGKYQRKKQLDALVA